MTGPVPTPSLHARRLLRGLTLRCPLCGRGAGLRGLGLPPGCPHCGLRYDRGESDYFLGSYTLNLFVALLAAAGVAAVGIVLSGRAASGWMIAGAAVLIIGLAVLFHPIARLTWLAMDLAFRPPQERDFERDSEDA